METWEIWGEIKKSFPGAKNSALRNKIFKETLLDGNVICLAKVIAFSREGTVKLKHIQSLIDEA